MGRFRSALYTGDVVHARLRPVEHKFRYRVFALALDVDEIDAVARSLPIFSRNRANVVSFFDRDAGAPGELAVGCKIRSVLADVGLSGFGAQITLLTYPRLWGYVFNPLSVYFCFDTAGRLGATVYEVTNTFRERRAYILRADDPQSCGKELYVSPFTATPGDYRFHTIEPGARVVVGVNFHDAEGPVLRTHFSGTRRELTTASLAAAVGAHPLMTLKVIAAIHFEAARLWSKGVPIVARHTSPAYSYRLVEPTPGARAHA